VLWRKNAFGCHSEAGCRFVERILTVVQTLRLQKRPVVEFLYQSLLRIVMANGLPSYCSTGERLQRQMAIFSQKLRRRTGRVGGKMVRPANYAAFREELFSNPPSQG
jgi:hypothetical protein